MKYFLIFLVIFLISCKSKNTNQSNNVDSIKIKKEVPVKNNQPGSFTAPCGFNVLMNESQIVEFAKSGNKKFFVDKKYAIPVLKTKIDGKVYSINVNLYKDKIDKIFYTLDIGYVKMEDVRFKEHYLNLYNMVKELNQYKTIKNTFSETYKSDFPVSYDGKPIEMVSFNLTESDTFECIKISIDQNPQNNTYFVWIEYTGAEIENYDSTLSKDLNFENL